MFCAFDQSRCEFETMICNTTFYVRFRMDLVVVRGKSIKNTRAFILIPPDCQQALEILCNTRDAGCAPPSNKYMFARRNADTPVSGTVVMKEFAELCALVEHPDRIRSTKLRKYIATVSQVSYIKLIVHELFNFVTLAAR